MGLPQIPLVNLDDAQMKRRVRENINYLLKTLAEGPINVGDDTSIPITGADPVLQITDDTAFVLLARFSADANGPQLELVKSRNALIPGHTIVQSDDNLGAISFGASNGASFDFNVARIMAHVDATPGASADMPTRLSFWTTPDGSATAAERWRITAAGFLRALADNTELQLGASQDLRLFHNGTDSIINNNTGTLLLQEGGSTVIRLAATGDTQIPFDNQELQIGFGQDLRLYHDGTNSIIRNETGSGNLQFGTEVEARWGDDYFEQATQVRETGIISATISGTTNDWAPTGIGTASLIRITVSGGNQILTGITGGVNGRRLTLVNISATNQLTLAGDDSGSSAANRIGVDTGIDPILINIGGSVRLWYDGTTSRWRIESSYRTS